MKKRISNKKYKSTIGLISHLILTKPGAVRNLLKRHRVVFSPAPTRGQLIAQVVELLAENKPSFNADLTKLLEVHIKYKGRDILDLDRKRKSQRSYYEEDQFLGGLLGGVAKNLIGGLFKKKNKPAGSTAATTSGSNAAEIEKMKADMQRQMLTLEMEQKRKAREDEQRRQREEEDRKREEKAGKKKQTNMLIATGVIVVTIVGITLAVTLRPKPKQVIQQ